MKLNLLYARKCIKISAFRRLIDTAARRGEFLLANASFRHSNRLPYTSIAYLCPLKKNCQC